MVVSDYLDALGATLWLRRAELVIFLVEAFVILGFEASFCADLVVAYVVLVVVLVAGLAALTLGGLEDGWAFYVLDLERDWAAADFYTLYYLEGDFDFEGLIKAFIFSTETEADFGPRDFERDVVVLALDSSGCATVVV